jgi:hypothetical protein
VFTLARKLYLALIFSILALATSVLASAPSLPSSLGPSNNTWYFSSVPSVSLTCSGSTDPDGDPINYSFYGNVTEGPSGYIWQGSDSNSWYIHDDGTSFSIAPYPTYSSIFLSVSDGYTRTAYANQSVVFMSDSFSLDTFSMHYDSSNSNGLLTFKVLVDGSSIYSRSYSSSGTYNYNNDLSLDVSSYNDGQPHELKFWVQHRYAPNSYVKFYFYNIDFSGPDEQPLQNSSSTSYTLPSDLGAIKLLWTCRACDNNSVCSNYTSPLFLNIVSLSECSSNYVFGFSLKDEETLNAISDNVSYTLFLDDDSSNTFYLSGSSSPSYKFCITPNITINLTGFLSFIPFNSSYSFTRYYYFTDFTAYNGLNNDLLLYTLSDTNDEIVTLNVQDLDHTPISNAIILIQRFFNTSWATTHMVKTDSLGRASGNYLLDNYYYNH